MVKNASKLKLVHFLPITVNHVLNAHDIGAMHNNGNVYQKTANRIGGSYYYKYMDLNAALKCMNNGNIRFVKPSVWKDQYEKRFYNADYSNVSSNPLQYAPRLYASCFSNQKDSESAWQIYAYGKTGLGSVCVQFTIDRKALRSELVRNVKNCDLYEGEVTYCRKYIIDNLHSPVYLNNGNPNPDYGTFFKPFDRDKYLNLLLLKREAFAHEKEVRIFIVPKNAKMMRSKDKFVKVDWSKIVKGVRVDSSISNEDYEKLEKSCRECGLPEPEKFDVYGDNGGRLVIL